MVADRIIRLHEGKVSSDSNPVSIPFDKTKYTQNDRYKKYASFLDNLRNVSIGEYFQKKSIIHNLSAELKTIIFLIIFPLTLVFSNIPVLVGTCVITFLYAILAKYPIRKILSRILKITPWILLFFAFQILLFNDLPQDKIIWQWKFITVTDVKIILGLRMLLHFVGAMISISVFTYTMEESEIIDGLKFILKPLEKLKVNTKIITVAVLMVMRFIPILTEEASHIVKTQIIREGIKSTNSFMGKIKAIIPIIVPLILQTIKRSENLSEALEARYF